MCRYISVYIYMCVSYLILRCVVTCLRLRGCVCMHQMVSSIYLFAGEYASMRECRDTTSCPTCEERFPSCQGLPDGFRPYPGKLLSPLFVKCQAERTMAVIRCVEGLFDPISLKCGATLEQGEFGSVRACV